MRKPFVSRGKLIQINHTYFREISVSEKERNFSYTFFFYRVHDQFDALNSRGNSN